MVNCYVFVQSETISNCRWKHKKLGFEFWERERERERESIRRALKIKGPFGYNLFLLKLKTENTVAK